MGKLDTVDKHLNWEIKSCALREEGDRRKERRQTEEDELKNKCNTTKTL